MGCRVCGPCKTGIKRKQHERKLGKLIPGGREYKGPQGERGWLRKGSEYLGVGITHTGLSSTVQVTYKMLHNERATFSASHAENSMGSFGESRLNLNVEIKSNSGERMCLLGSRWQQKPVKFPGLARVSLI